MVHSLVRPTHAMPCPRQEQRGEQRERARGAGRGGARGEGHLTLPQSRCEDDVADAIFAFFLLSFSFSPASTTSLASLRHSGQYLRRRGRHPLPSARRAPQP